ncbi:MAG: hypothetical protein A2622_03575 [Bdellovibrionales bacterium RIFCSPHIGHO2_01_FULL_40_29]|nr:MAG: hypothetical protein A2622_03575 [Bdellovibrionales bacterium RIFCSPHIGHO2_01_FULL_40_29]OFZ35399.1 MAG: hypothetical protein A3D17_08455 [Bdellovibrionales bacterium RIFCSPHIGHO2_02_FULL_40_15]
MWSVRMLSGPNVGQIFDLKLGKNVFGRGSSCDFMVQSVGISKEHCEIHVYKDKIIIIDLKSSNGTFVNGIKIQNSLMRVGDKISLFDIIMDLIPTPDIRPPKNLPRVINPASRLSSGSTEALMPPPPPVPMMNSSYPDNGSAAFQMQQYSQSFEDPNNNIYNAVGVDESPSISFQQRIELFIETVLMPAVYRLALVFPFKQVLMSFILIFIFGVTLLSTIPLTILTDESNFIEGTKRAKSVAHAMAKVNEQALLTGQFGNLTVNDALKEEGIKDAFIVQQSDGNIVAPSEKVGRDASSSFILKALKESRTTVGRVDGTTIGASYPIGVYDPTTGEPTVKYHAVVYYDIASLNVDEGRVISLFMQTLVLASVLGLMLFFLFSRLIEYPLKSLNQQLDQALRDKTDRTEVLFNYPAIQQLTTHINTLLNRAWNSADSSAEVRPQQNRDLEYNNLVEMITQPAIVIGAENRIVALNTSFEQICQMNREALVNQSYQIMSDSSLVQNMDSLIVRATQSPYEKHRDRIPFSQFECDIQCQVFLDLNGQPEYYLMTLNKAESPM